MIGYFAGMGRREMHTEFYVVKLPKAHQFEDLRFSTGTKSISKAHIYHAIVKSTITYAAETWCLKKTVSKLNSTEMDFWRPSARISREDKIRNIII